MIDKKTLEEKKKELLEALIIDEEKIMNAEKKRNMILSEGCKGMDHYLEELKKLEPEKSHVQLMNEIENYVQHRS